MKNTNTESLSAAYYQHIAHSHSISTNVTHTYTAFVLLLLTLPTETRFIPSVINKYLHRKIKEASLQKNKVFITIFFKQDLFPKANLYIRAYHQHVICYANIHEAFNSLR